MPVVSTTVWILTAIFIIALLAFDFIFHVRKAHIPTIGEAAKWTAIYVSVAILFGVHGDRADAHLTGGAHDAQRDFAAVRHQKFADIIDHAFQAMPPRSRLTGVWTTKNPRSFCNPPQTSP